MPEWISAFCSLFALVAAAWAALTAARVHKIERDRDVKADEDKLKAQAGRVAAWSAVHLDAKGSALAYGVVVNNGSTTPIFDVVLEAQDVPGKLRPLTLRLLPPGQYFVESHKDRSGWALAEHTSALAGFTRPITRKENWCVTHLAFRDAQNNLWSRNNSGLLERAGS
ncbi:hypothetical protein [Arthrobacter sp. AZCC_0090]|uniref:hypothetical protein n=1 Tax=Arthrobacter sp. AZCC_0090 TaxID=2735881 RepID=UPI001607E386|nr:hypothetical protein [Arthrobacter sp. AZCC_0090]MBB6404246.1 hypothetical protein [Arthrobacter sp. AZCC_0090]